MINKIFSKEFVKGRLLGADALGRLRRLDREVEQLRLQVGQLQTALQKMHGGGLRESEFTVFSQFGEDGILQYLIRHCDQVPTSFVEFGVEDYREANSKLLLQQDNWRGLILDGSEAAMAAVRSRDLCWRYDLTAVAAFITRDNINGLIRDNGFAGPLGVLSIDIDGNDYWVWERIDVVDPVIVVAEYNSVFGGTRAVSVPYDPAFVRGKAHHSNLYWGCSLAALVHLADRKGLDFVGCNRAGNNAFFVKRGRSDLRPISPAEGFVESRFRESRDAEGNLTFLTGADRLRAIHDLPLQDVVSATTIRCGDLLE